MYILSFDMRVWTTAKTSITISNWHVWTTTKTSITRWQLTCILTVDAKFGSNNVHKKHHKSPLNPRASNKHIIPKKDLNHMGRRERERGCAWFSFGYQRFNEWWRLIWVKIGFRWEWDWRWRWRWRWRDFCVEEDIKQVLPKFGEL